MAETNAELGRAVTDALRWLEATPETAGAVLGMNAQTLDAMSHGIVPMRSLVIRFAGALSQHCLRQSGAPDWWADVDAWLRLAGYPPRRETEGAATPQQFRSNGGGAPPAVSRPPRQLQEPPARAHRPAEPHLGPSPATVGDGPAREFYHPVYECRSVRGAVVHTFWILDRGDQRVFEITMPANVDYKARATQVKQDLAALPRATFERKYARFRLNNPG